MTHLLRVFTASIEDRSSVHSEQVPGAQWSHVHIWTHTYKHKHIIKNTKQNLTKTHLTNQDEISKSCQTALTIS